MQQPYLQSIAVQATVACQADHIAAASTAWAQHIYNAALPQLNKPFSSNTGHVAVPTKYGKGWHAHRGGYYPLIIYG